MTPILQYVIIFISNIDNNFVFFFLYHVDRMKKQKINPLMLVEFMAPLRSTKWLAIFTSLPASKYSLLLTEYCVAWLIQQISQ